MALHVLAAVAFAVLAAVLTILAALLAGAAIGRSEGRGGNERESDSGGNKLDGLHVSIP